MKAGNGCTMLPVKTKTIVFLSNELIALMLYRSPCVVSPEPPNSPLRDGIAPHLTPHIPFALMIA